MSSLSTMLPLDNSNGGFYDIDAFVTLPEDVDPYLLERQFNFIPTYSSLDVGKGLVSIVSSDLNKVYSPLQPPTAPKDIPYDNFFSNELSSEQHIQFTLNNGQWLMDELDGDPSTDAFYSCLSSCADDLPLSISGPSQLCTSDTYNVRNLSLRANTIWSISSPGGFTLTPNGNSVTVTSLGSVNGTVTLSATIQTDCGSFIVTKDIYAGAQRPMNLDENGEEIGVFNFCNGYYEGITFDNGIALEWEWTKVSGNFTMVANNSSGSAQFFSNFTTFGMVEVRRRDSCGWSAKTFLIINFSDCSGGGNPLLFSTSPNPADNVLVIDIAENQESRSGTSKFENRSSTSYTNNSFREDNSISTLYNQSGIPVMTIQPAIGGMNVSGLPTGHYLLVITYGEGETETHHILVK